jgi:hypothetical protein
VRTSSDPRNTCFIWLLRVTAKPSPASPYYPPEFAILLPCPQGFCCNHLCVELASNTLSNNLHISPAAAALGRNLRKLVASSEHASRPASPSKVDVRVLVHGIKLLAKRSQAAGLAGTAGLSEDSLALVGLEPGAEGVESIDVVGGAGGVRAGAVGVEVLVNVEDEVGGAAVEVGDFVKSGARAVGDEGGSVGPLVTGEEDLVASGAGLADGGHGGLDGGGPLVDVDIVLRGESVLRSLVDSWKLEARLEILTGSFMRPNAILALPLYLVAICDQTLAN